MPVFLVSVRYVWMYVDGYMFFWLAFLPISLCVFFPYRLALGIRYIARALPCANPDGTTYIKN